MGEGCEYIGKIGNVITCRDPSTDNINPGMMVHHGWTAEKDWQAALESVDLAHDIELADINLREARNRERFIRTVDPDHQRLRPVTNCYKNSLFIKAYS
jgi:hypothetical protein